MEKFFASLRDRGRSDKTITVYRNDLKQFESWCRESGVRRLDQLTVDVLESFQRQLATGGYRPERDSSRKGYSYLDTANKPNTLKNKMTVIRQLIRFAVKREMVAKDPAPGYYLPVPKTKQAHCFSADDLHRLFNAISADNTIHKDLFHFLRLTGLRSDELCWLLKEDVILDRRCLMIRPKKCPQTARLWQPKRGNARVVPLCPEAFEIAKRLITSSPGPWLFWSPNAYGKQKGHWSPSTVWLLLKRYKKSAKLKEGTVHTFRHVFCSFLANQNVSPFQVVDPLSAVKDLPFDQMIAPALVCRQF